MILKIKKGNHYSTLLSFIKSLGLTVKNGFEYKIKFNPNCLYDLKSLDNYDCNKLCGVSTSYTHIEQSARIGWRCIDGENIQIMTFVHDKGTFLEPQLLGVVSPNEWFECSIDILGDTFLFLFSSKNIENEIEIKVSKKAYTLKYKLGFYFGGNNTAPNDMNVEFM